MKSSAKFEEVRQSLRRQPVRWLVTGAAGFIGSHLVEQLLLLDQWVLGVDNFSTGKRANLMDIETAVTPEQWARFEFCEGNICDYEVSLRCCRGAKYVLHQAALGSVPRSIADPLRSHASNVDGFAKLLLAAREAGVTRFVYASSSSVYGDNTALPKLESEVGRPLSPYAATKLIDEIYAAVFQRCYGLSTVGLRYFNVFGPRQDPAGAYTPVIPAWINALVSGLPVKINGDGKTSRDFCFVANVVQANLLAAVIALPNTDAQRFNVGCGQQTSLLRLFHKIRTLAAERNIPAIVEEPIFQPDRAGDVKHTLADISKAAHLLGYEPSHLIDAGLRKTFPWYLRKSLNAA